MRSCPAMIKDAMSLPYQSFVLIFYACNPIYIFSNRTESSVSLLKLHCIVLYNITLYYIILLLHYIIYYAIILYTIYNTILYYITLHCTALHYMDMVVPQRDIVEAPPSSLYSHTL